MVETLVDGKRTEMNFQQTIALSLLQIVCKLRNGVTKAVLFGYTTQITFSIAYFIHTTIAGLEGVAFNTLYTHTLSLTESRTGPSPLPNINVNRGPRPGNHVADSSR